MPRHAQGQLGETGVQQRAHFVVALAQRLRQPLRQRGIEARALAQGGEHDGLDQGAIARIRQRRQRGAQACLQRAAPMQHVVQHAGGGDARGDAGAHRGKSRRAFR